jgi:GT2 family glycosyltransferase
LFDKGEISAMRFEHAGAAGGMMDILGYPFCRGRMMAHVEEDHGQYDQIAPVFWATGACLLIRTQIYKELGGLDANFFAHQEEIDLCWRIHNAADLPSTIVCLPQAVVYHVGGGTLGYESPRKTFLNFRNNLLMLTKNLPASRLWWVMIVRFFMDYLAALQMLLTGQTPNAKAVFQARQAYQKMKIGYRLSASGKHNAIKLLAKRSIVLDYYLFKKKK